MSLRLLVGLIAAIAALSLGAAGSPARPASHVTINMIVSGSDSG